MSTFYIDNYLFLSKNKSENGKKIKKRLKKKKLLQIFTCLSYDTTFENDSIQYLRQYLIDIKRSKSKSHTGFLTDDNILIQDEKFTTPVKIRKKITVEL
jgi:hypothetical protein